MAGNQDTPGTVIDATRAGVNGTGSLRYPAEELPYFTIIKFVKFNRTNPKSPAVQVDQADVILPLPMNLREYYQIHYSEVDFSVLGGLDEVGTQIFNEYANKGSFTDDMWNEIGRNAPGLMKAMARKTLGFVSDGASLFDRISTDIVNPHITSVFRGVSPREHQLSWRFSPSSPDETDALNQIKTFFRDHMHPTKKDAFLLNFPDEVYVQFWAGDRPFLYPIFKAVVRGFEAPSSSDGTNAFFAGTDSPVIVEFHLSLQEVESVTRETFGQLYGTGSSANTGSTQTGPGGVLGGI